MNPTPRTAWKVIGAGSDDPRIQHFQVRTVDIDTQPVMPAMADGLPLGEGPLHISVRRHALAVIAAEIPEVQTHAAAG